MTYVKAARVDDVPRGRVTVVHLGDEEVALCNVDGQICAIANRCTHDDGPLGEGHLLGREVECPRHGAHFDACTGAVKRLPAIVPVPTFAVRIEDGNVLVDVE